MVYLRNPKTISLSEEEKKKSNKFKEEKKKDSSIPKFIKEKIEQADFNKLYFEITQLLLQKKKDEATEILVKYILNDNHIYTTRDDERSEMWIYCDGIYIPQGRTFIQEICREILSEIINSSLVNQVIFKIECDTYIDQKEFFEDPPIDLIAIKNGIFNIKTKKLSKFNPKIRFFNKFPLTYRLKEDCIKIKRFFNSLFKNEEEILVIQEIFGYLLLREYRYEKSFMFLGGGRNGKGKTIEIMKRFLGVENCVEIPLSDLENDLFAVGELFKKMANLCGDLSKTALKNTGRFKNLTARDMISAPRKFKTRITFENYAKFIFACNQLPITYDITPAFFQRWIILDFPYTFLPKLEIGENNTNKLLKLQDPNIIDKITNEFEMSGLLNWALEGLDRIIKNKTFSYSHSTNEVEIMWLRKSSSLNAFIMDCIAEEYDYDYPKFTFRNNYYKYCKKHKLKMVSDKIIKNTLEIELGVYDDQLGGSSSGMRVWKGIKPKI